MPLQMLNPTAAPTVVPRTQATALSTYRPLTGEGVDNNGTHWLNGLSFAPFGCVTPTGFAVDDPCDDTPAESAENLTYPAVGDCVTFLPFRIETMVSHPLVVGTSDAEVEKFLRDHAELSRSFILAREVFDSALAPANPSLMDQADIVVGIDDTPVGALSGVEDGLGQKLSGGIGMIHVTPGTLVYLDGEGVLEFDGQNFRTATGHYVVGDAGYTGGAPATGAVTVGAPWIYGSGLVYFKLTGAKDTGAPWELFNYTRNVATLNTEEFGIFTFEPCTVVAAQVNAP
jgi:hypothetical protein